jgi:polyphenol oxidase
MSFISTNGLKYFQFELLDRQPVCHAIFTRQGGVSPVPYHSLNIGGNMGDSDENIIENKKIIFNTLNIPFDSQYDVWQVHGCHVDIPELPRKPLQKYVQADAILTDNPGLTLVMRFADCVPILLYAPVKHVAGIVHAGWQGTLINTIGAAIKSMKSRFNIDPQEIIAGIGPSIGPDHYSIHEDVLIRVKDTFGQGWQKVIQFTEGKIYLNLWKANEINLLNSGVEKIEIAKICTACHTEDWFSHRAEGGKTGRFCALIKLQNE